MMHSTLNYQLHAPFYHCPNTENLSPVPYLVNQSPAFDCEVWEQERKNDEEFINNFVRHNRSNKITRKKTLGLKIFEARKHLIEIVNLKKELEIDCEAVDVNCEDFDVKWEGMVLKQNRINELLLRFTNNAISDLQIAIQRRKKKRLWIQNKKLKQKLKKVEIEKRIKEKHALIDKYLNEKSVEAESLKRKEALKRQADAVLHEVRGKKYEAKKMLNLLSALLKLRELRRQKEIAQGGYFSQQITETFNNVISHFTEMWKKQSEIYNLEEKGLNVMLEESEIPQCRISNFQNILNQWDQALFGMESNDDNYRFLTQADDDLDSLIFVRREWDQYISDSSSVLSSSIPVGWVLPPTTENDEWKSYIRRKKKL